MCSGAKIYLIGTAHFSKESCEDVSRIIQATQPDIVMVELCKQEPEIFLFIQLYPTLPNLIQKDTLSTLCMIKKE